VGNDKIQPLSFLWSMVLLFVVAMAILLSVLRLPATASVTDQLGLVAGCALVILIFSIGVIVVYYLAVKIDLTHLLSEAGGGASLSRFQFLIFTFVISLSLFLIVVSTNNFPAKIPPEILTLLGISASTYAVSKGIQATSPGGLQPKSGAAQGGGGGADGAAGGAAPGAGGGAGGAAGGAAAGAGGGAGGAAGGAAAGAGGGAGGAAGGAAAGGGLQG
jgi:hypothetical protein